jgi:c-di-GMP-binding flagellar brake protein YcgR
MTKSNIRQAYRLRIDQDSGIILTLNPELAEVKLVNFSANGLMLGTNTPSAFALGLELSFKLSFPAGADLPVYRLEGKAVVVRLEMNPKTQKAHLGLRFQVLGPEARRALPKIIHYYMLEEQRGRTQGERVKPLDEP